jgi:hypothetical protein
MADGAGDSPQNETGGEMKFSSRSYKWQGTAYFFFFAAAFFLGAAFLAGFLAASFLAGFFLVAINNPPFQSADAGRRKFLRVVDECHLLGCVGVCVMKLLQTVNAFFLAQSPNFSFRALPRIKKRARIFCGVDCASLANPLSMRFREHRANFGFEFRRAQCARFSSAKKFAIFFAR